MTARTPTMWAAFAVAGLFVASCAEGETITAGEPARPAPRAEASAQLPSPTAPSLASVFPFEPLLATPDVPGDAAALFAAGDDDRPENGPCLVDPEPNALVPKDWEPIEIRFTPAGSQTLFEIRLRSPAALNDLVVYTTATTWRIPPDIWGRMVEALVDQPIEISLRGVALAGGRLVAGPSRGDVATLRIAPVAAGGKILYNRAGSDETREVAVEGLRVGSGAPVTVIGRGDVPASDQTAEVTCIQCHQVTPDGQSLGLWTVDSVQGWKNDLFAISEGLAGRGVLAPPSFLGAEARRALADASDDLMVFSPARWRAGERVAISSYVWGAREDGLELRELIWIDLNATSRFPQIAWDNLARDGDPMPGAIMPAWRHDGSEITYVSWRHQAGLDDLRGEADLYTIPYDERRGGAARPIPGAADPAYNEYYPSYSPGDALLTFTRAPAGSSTHSQVDAEIYVIPREGGEPTRLVANDPPACTARVSPGVRNSWSRWAPSATSHDRKTYYWLVFSSDRVMPPDRQQIHMTAVVLEGDTVMTHGAVRVASQAWTGRNLMPSWSIEGGALPDEPER